MHDGRVQVMMFVVGSTEAKASAVETPRGETHRRGQR